MIYSLDKINEMAEGDEDFVHSVISVFLEEVPADLEALEKEIEAKNHEQIYKLAHKIKPNVDLLGMEATRANALDIETMGKNMANMDQIESKFPQLKKDILQVITELQNDFHLQ
ncbi:Hpt domain-containing protein [Croceivirga thetidis]|uniref:Hpt domain-containing protein n=1 Tax=Croceivirga thetidis TaxID=2721623 RepID=A0ABX1GU69_9FLAO|nr:Hpt domain-containing protein [Croceivirga thetidis]NKI33487.1 Hpt domain-containing protein [Croceivirga thetidis]